MVAAREDQAVDAARHPNGRGRDERHVCDECAHRIAQLEAELTIVRGHAAAAYDLLAAAIRRE